MHGLNPLSFASTARALVSGLGLAVLAVLGACSDRPDDFEALTLNEPEKQHQIAFTDRAEVLLVEVVPYANGLSDNQQVDVIAFLSRYKAQGTGRLSIASPSGAREHAAAALSVQHVKALAAEVGIPPRAISVEHVRDLGSRSALRLSFERPVAVPPVCGDWSEDLGPNRERVHYPNFGCATQRSVALMVANPRDLVSPAPETARSAERRSVTWSRYVTAAPSGGGASASSSSSSGGGQAPDAK